MTFIITNDDDDVPRDAMSAERADDAQIGSDGDGDGLRFDGADFHAFLLEANLREVDAGLVLM